MGQKSNMNNEQVQSSPGPNSNQNIKAAKHQPTIRQHNLIFKNYSSMASTFRLILPSSTLLSLSRQKPFIPPLNCSSSNPIIPESDNGSVSSTSQQQQQLEARKKLSLLKKSQGSALQRPEPPNFEIGWKRTKEIKHEKPIGWQIADFLEKLESLMGREYGSKELLAKVGYIVADRAREEADVLREGGEVEERVVTELYRVLKLMEMDFEMVKAAVKEETVKERVEVAKARCRQAILVALSF